MSVRIKWAYMIILVTLVFFASSCEPISTKEYIGILAVLILLMAIVCAIFGGLVALVSTIVKHQAYKDIGSRNMNRISNCSSLPNTDPSITVAALLRQKKRKLLLASLACIILAVVFPVATAVLASIAENAHNLPVRDFINNCWWISAPLSVALTIASLGFAIGSARLKPTPRQIRRWGKADSSNRYARRNGMNDEKRSPLCQGCGKQVHAGQHYCQYCGLALAQAEIDSSQPVVDGEITRRFHSFTILGTVAISLAVAGATLMLVAGEMAASGVMGSGGLFIIGAMLPFVSFVLGILFVVRSKRKTAGIIAMVISPAAFVIAFIGFASSFTGDIEHPSLEPGVFLSYAIAVLGLAMLAFLAYFYMRSFLDTCRAIDSMRVTPLRPGDWCIMLSDVGSRDGQAFRAYERVVVESVEPGLVVPGNQYVVYSKATDNWVRLGEMDIAGISTTPVDYAIVRKKLEKVGPVITAAGSAIILVSAILPSYQYGHSDSTYRSLIITLVSLALGVFILFRSLEALGVSKKLPERPSSRMTSLVLSLVAVTAAVFFMLPVGASFIAIGRDMVPYGINLFLCGGLIALLGSVMMVWTGTAAAETNAVAGGAGRLPAFQRAMLQSSCPRCSRKMKIGAKKCELCGGEFTTEPFCRYSLACGITAWGVWVVTTLLQLVAADAIENHVAFENYVAVLCVVFVVSFVLAIGAIVLSKLGKRRLDRNQDRVGKVMADSGLLLGSLYLIILFAPGVIFLLLQASG